MPDPLLTTCFFSKATTFHPSNLIARIKTKMSLYPQKPTKETQQYLTQEIPFTHSFIDKQMITKKLPGTRHNLFKKISAPSCLINSQKETRWRCLNNKATMPLLCWRFAEAKNNSVYQQTMAASCDKPVSAEL